MNAPLFKEREEVRANSGPAEAQQLFRITEIWPQFSSSSGDHASTFLGSSGDTRCVEGPQLPDNPWLARNNHRSGKLGSHLCKRWTGGPGCRGKIEHFANSGQSSKHRLH